jgi:predicted ATPase/DNA-binding SARP family transcriptional activator
VVAAAGADPVGIGRQLERALAARLALARGAAVPDGRLSRDLWGEVDRPAERLRVLASRLRRALGPHAAALTRTRAGYALAAVPADLVAAEAAASRLRTGLRAGDHDGVRAAAADALGGWRGAAFADLRAIPYAAVEGQRLDGWRVELSVERLAAEIALGAGTSVVGELERLAAEHGLHERLHGLLAVALYRAGRQAEALDRLAGLRRALAGDLGVDPGPELAALELRLLRHDPALSPPPAGVPPAGVLPAGVPGPDGDVADLHGSGGCLPGAEGVPAGSGLVARLPVPAGEFVGRQAEHAALLGAVAAPGLVTVTGPPGSGKTRLALEVARAARDAGRRVALVELAPVSAPEAVSAAVAGAAGLTAGLAAGEVRRSAAALAGALLLIDNAEHLVEPVAALVAELRRYADLTVLVTSQRPLLLAGERIERLGPLPPRDAARLFATRAAGGHDPGTVGVVCAAVDHLPLGIELAAGLTRTFSVPQLAERMGLRLLVGGPRDAGPRHVSLHAALDWSHELLPPAERAVLRRLAVFAGGWTLEAAERVVPGGATDSGADSGGVDRAGVAPALASLVDRCLVTVAGGRFALLETVREYAADRLRAAGEEAATLARHLAWCHDHVAAYDVLGEDGAAHLAAILAEWPNLHAALDRAPGTGRAAGALGLATALDATWQVRGEFRQARRYYAALVDAPGVGDAPRAEALSNYGLATALAGAVGEATRLLARAAELARAAGADELAMRVLYHRGVLEIQRGCPGEAVEPLTAGLALADVLRRERATSAFVDALGSASLYAGDPAGAAELHAAACAYDRSAGYDHGLARGLVNEADALFGAGRTGDALERLAEAEPIAGRLEDRSAFAVAALLRGALAAAAGDLPAAAGHLNGAVTHAVAAGSDAYATLARADLAEVLIRAGDVDGGRELLDTVRAATTDRGLAWLAALPTEAALALADNDPDRARDLASQARAEYRARGFGWPQVIARLDRVSRETPVKRAGKVVPKP